MAISNFSSRADFEIRWYPFQLNPMASDKAENRIAMYMKKFGGGREQTLARSKMMEANFKSVGLPYKFTDAGVVCNTWNGHRLLAYAFHKGGAKMQDAVMEELFLNYFGEEKYLNDPEVLKNAGRKGNMVEDDLKRVVDDPEFFTEETEAEMQLGRALRVNGVPFFVMSRVWPENEWCDKAGCGKPRSEGCEHCPRPQSVSGAQDPEVFKQRIGSLL